MFPEPQSVQESNHSHCSLSERGSSVARAAIAGATLFPLIPGMKLPCFPSVLGKEMHLGWGNQGHNTSFLSECLRAFKYHQSCASFRCTIIHECCFQVTVPLH